MPSAVKMSTERPVSTCPKCSCSFRERKGSQFKDSCCFPIILCCGHTLCTACIKRDLENSDKVGCIVCHTSHPFKSPDFLPDYYALGVAIDAGINMQANNTEVKGPNSPMHFGDEVVKQNKSPEFKKVCRMYKKLRMGRRNINKAITSNRSIRCALMEQITSEFHYLHSLLELRKWELMDCISKICEEEAKSLTEMQCEASVLIDEMERVFFNEQKCSIGNIPEGGDDVLQKAKSFKCLPNLITGDDACTSTSRIRLWFDDSLKDMFKSIGEIFVTASASPEHRDNVPSVQESSRESKLNSELLRQENHVVDEQVCDVEKCIPGGDVAGVSANSKTATNSEEACGVIPQVSAVNPIKMLNTEDLHVLEQSRSEKSADLCIDSIQITDSNAADGLKLQFTVCEHVDQLENMDRQITNEVQCSQAEVNLTSHLSTIGTTDYCAKPESSQERRVTCNEQYLVADGPAKEWCVMMECMVCISHVRNPGMFWVHIWSDIPALKEMENKINDWCKSPEANNHIPTTLKIGGIYLALSSRDNRWHRVRLQRLSSMGSTATFHSQAMKIHTVASQGGLDSNEELTDDENEDQAEVMFMDWGNRALVPVSDLRDTKEEFLELPSMAKQCSLWQIVPRNEMQTWMPQATEVFLKFTGKNMLLMRVMEQHGNVFWVDLCQPASSDIHNDVPVSVRDALVFLELGYFENVSADETVDRRATRLFPEPEPLQKGECFDVVLTEAESPDLFFVQKVGENSRVLSSMFFDLQNTYSKETSALQTLYSPRIGDVCVAQYSADKQWYRALVTGLVGGALVEVLFVDFGNKERIPYWQLRKISDHFLSFPIQAFKCRLADVAPMDTISWSTEAKDAFVSLAGKKQLLMKVGDVSAEDADVSLFEVKDGLEVSIADLLIKLHHACYLTRYDQLQPTEFRADSARTLSSVMNEHDPLAVILEKVKECGSPPKVGDTSKPPAIFPVIVCHVDSPSMFFVHLLTLQLKSFFEHKNSELQIVCEKSKQTKVEWQTDSLCAFLDPEDGTWYRGKVLSVDEEEECAEVMFIDYGCVGKIPVGNLCPLTEKFQFQPMAVRCHLPGIVPAGGGKGWTRLANEYLQEDALSGVDVFIVAKGPLDNGSLPADLLVETVTEGGALEPRMIQHLSITQMLLDRGLAIPKSRGRVISDVSEMGKLLKSKEHGDVFPRTKYTKKPKTQKYSLTSYAKSLWNSPESKLNNQNRNRKVGKQLTCAETLIKSTSGSNSKFEQWSKTQAKTAGAKPVNACVQEQIINAKSCPSLKFRDSITQMHGQGQYFRWKPPVFPREVVTKVVPTHVDHDGYIYFHVLDPASKVIGIIRNNIIKKEAAGGLHPCRGILRAGQACIAKFWYDSCWYRAEVVKTFSGAGDSSYQVFFVDYGNTESVPPTEVSIDLVMENVPKQCLMGKLYGIQPISGDGRWPSKVLDHLQEILVDKVCTVSFVDKDRSKKEIILILPDGMPLNKLLVDKKMAFDLHPSQTTCSESHGNCSKQNCRESGNSEGEDDAKLSGCLSLPGDYDAPQTPKASDPIATGHLTLLGNCSGNQEEQDCPATSSKTLDDENGDGANVHPKVKVDADDEVKHEQNACKNDQGDLLQFTEITSFEIGQVFPAIVTDIIEADCIHLQQMRLLSPSAMYQEDINRRFDDFIQMMSKLRDNVDGFPSPAEVRVGMPMCGEYTFDGNWYRCITLEAKSDGYLVKFVDYGNCEVLPPESLRTLPGEYMECPAMAIRCKIHGIFPVNGTWDNKDVLLMENLLLNNGGQTVWVRVEELYPLAVSIYSKDPSTEPKAQVVYKKLADQGVIVWIDDYMEN